MNNLKENVVYLILSKCYILYSFTVILFEIATFYYTLKHLNIMHKRVFFFNQLMCCCYKAD